VSIPIICDDRKGSSKRIDKLIKKIISGKYSFWICSALKMKKNIKTGIARAKMIRRIFELNVFIKYMPNILITGKKIGKIKN
jgi:hypothetical protein